MRRVVVIDRETHGWLRELQRPGESLGHVICRVTDYYKDEEHMMSDEELSALSAQSEWAVRRNRAMLEMDADHAKRYPRGFA